MNINTNEYADKLNARFIDFLENSPTAFHAVDNVRAQLLDYGFVQLKETDCWQLERGRGYFVVRNDSSLLAFYLPAADFETMHLVASHADSPGFKLKYQPELRVEQKYTRLNVEPYGGMICSTWLDRPLSIAGRLMLREGQEIQSRLVMFDRDLCLIPNLAIHLNRKVNEGQSFQFQKDMLPLYGGIDTPSLTELLADEAEVEPGDILGADLFLYQRTRPCIWGADSEFISGARLDDLQCAFSSLMGFLHGRKEGQLSVYCLFDNEEVGSMSMQGADSDFLRNTLERVSLSMGQSREAFLAMAAGSIMISADNAHAVHPNYPEMYDQSNRPYLNGGIVLKHNARQKYCSDAYSTAKLLQLCELGDIPVQYYSNRPDLPGGSTLGNIACTQLSMHAVDLGLPQLAMHSAYETAGTLDTQYLYQLCTLFFG